MSETATTTQPSVRKKVGRPPKFGSQNLRRYNLVLHANEFAEVKEIAEEKGVSFLQVIQGFVRFGIYVYRETRNDAVQIILRKKKGNEAEDTQILVL